jgi:hypothetical protein
MKPSMKQDNYLTTAAYITDIEQVSSIGYQHIMKILTFFSLSVPPALHAKGGFSFIQTDQCQT